MVSGNPDEEAYAMRLLVALLLALAALGLLLAGCSP